MQPAEKVVGGRLLGAKLVRDEGRGRREEHVRGGRGDDDEVEVLRVDAGVLERLPRGRERQVARRLARSGDAALLDPRPRRDPLVGGVHHALEVGVRQHLVGDVGADAGDPDRDAVPGDVPDHSSPSVTANVSVPRTASFAAHRGRRLSAADRAAHALQLACQLELVPGHDDALEAHVVDTREERELAAVLLVGEDGDGARLGHGLDHEDAGHDRTPGEVPGEVPLVLAHELARHDPDAWLELDHLVEQQERVAVREDLFDLPPPERRCVAHRARLTRSPSLPAARAGGRGPGARSTSRSRPACVATREISSYVSPKTSRSTTASALVRGEARERCGQLPALVGEERGPRRVAVLTGRLVLERERLGLADALARKAVAARVHDEAVEPGRELRLAAKLAQPRAELHERLLRSVARLLEIAHELRGESVHARGMPLDERVERPSVAVLCLADEVHVAELPVCERPPVRRLTIGLTRRRGGWLHGPVSVVPRMADALTPETVEPLLSGRFGRPYLYEDSCESTQQLLELRPRGGSGRRLRRPDRRPRAPRAEPGSRLRARPCSARSCSSHPRERSIPELSLVGGRRRRGDRRGGDRRSPPRSSGRTT